MSRNGKKQSVSLPKYLRDRSLHGNIIIDRPQLVEDLRRHYRRVSIASIDTVKEDLKREVLLGFRPTFPYHLITCRKFKSKEITPLADPRFNEDVGVEEDIDNAGEDCLVAFWLLAPPKTVKLAARLAGNRDAGYLPVTSVSTAWSYAGEMDLVVQVLWRSDSFRWTAGEACIEVRFRDFAAERKNGGQAVIGNMYERVGPEEARCFAGVCFALLGAGWITVLAGTRVYFFWSGKESSHTPFKWPENDAQRSWWTEGTDKATLIFEIDEFIKDADPTSGEDVEGSISVINGAKDDTSILVSFGRIDPRIRKGKMYTFLIDPLARKAELLSSLYEVNHLPTQVLRFAKVHNCSEHCGREPEERCNVRTFAIYHPGEYDSLSELVWDEGSLVLTGWESQGE